MTFGRRVGPRTAAACAAILALAPPADLAADDGTTAPSSIRAGQGSPTFVHEDQVFGQGDPVGVAGDRFGASVAVSGDTAVVGAPTDDTAAGVDAGAAYVFVRSGTAWTLQQKLFASDGAAGDQFGASVSISGDTVVVGAGLADTAAGADAGAAYVFVRSGTVWAEQQKLAAADAAAGDQLGASVAVSGDTAVVGASLDDTPGGTDAGSVYAFLRSGTTWSQQQKLVASDGAATDSFGTSVSLAGNTAVVGAPFDNVSVFSDAGSAYAFVRSGTTWSQQQKLVAADADTGDRLGTSVSVSADTAVAGAPLDNIAAVLDAGSAYVFVRSGASWSQQQRVAASDLDFNDIFGQSVSVSGDALVVGAPFDNTSGGLNAGSVYVFSRSGTAWTQAQQLAAPDASGGDEFGSSVALDGPAAVIGAPLDNTPAGTDAGSAHVYRELQADLSVTKTDGQSTAVPGLPLTYTIVVTNGGPGAAPGAVVADTFPAALTGVTWTCVATGGATCAASGAGNINGTVNLPSGGTVTYTATGTVVPGATGTLANTATVTAPGGVTDPFPGNNSATDTDTLTPQADLAVTKTDGQATAVPGQPLTYTIVASNAGPSNAPGTVVTDTFPAALTGVTWTCAGAGGATCPPAGSGNINTTVSLPAGGSVTYAATGTVAAGATGTLSNTATVAPSGGVTDPNPGNNTATDVDTLAPQADLGITKTDGQTTAVPGLPLTYTIVVANPGPSNAAGALVSDTFPPLLTGVTWTCTAAGGATCTAGGSGNINDTVNLPAGGTVTYTATGTVPAGATGTLTNTATVAAPGGVPDPNPGNNSATDVDTLTPQADLGVTKTDSADPVSSGDPLVYLLTVNNAGPSDATSVTLVDTLPAGVTFVSSTPGAPICALAGSTLTCALGTITVGGGATVTINTTVNAGASGILVNTATVSGSGADPDPRDNAASAATAVGRRDGELAHGTDALYDLAAEPGPVADEDVFRINQKPYSSYEVVVDATSGDVGAGAGPLVERVAPDGTTVLQVAVAVGAGPSRSLRFRNTTAAEVEGDTVRVRSASCGTDCGPDDVYRIRAYETTYSVPRFNNAGTQVTVLVLQNPTSYAISGDAYFRTPPGTLVGLHAFTLAPKATLVLNTAAVPGAGGVSGAVIVAHDGRYGDLTGKTVALEPATGFSFDSALEPRPRNSFR